MGEKCNKCHAFPEKFPRRLIVLKRQKRACDEDSNPSSHILERLIFEINILRLWEDYLIFLER